MNSSLSWDIRCHGRHFRKHRRVLLCNFLLTFSGSQEGDGFEVPVRESKRPFSTRDVLPGISFDDIVSILIPLIRRVVREEVERCVPLFLHPCPRSTPNQIDSSEVRRWQLHFVKKLPSPIYTGSRIESEDNGPVKIVIVDATSNTTITSGPLSSLKIQILVLDGDFGKDDQEDWSEKDFKDHVVHEREGKRPLVAGELTITLRNGVGYIGDISFTDNSSWTRSGRFRLGAQNMQNASSEVRIREARSEAFVVKDHRGESYKKHHPPSLGDEVWRLERIAKGGKFHTRLAYKGIHCVKDFLQLYVTDPSSLRRILGGGISNRTWDKIIEHVNACVLDGNLYVYYRAEHGFGLLLNSIYQVVGVTFDGQSYQSLSTLPPPQMDLVEILKQRAYQNVIDFVPIDDPFGPSRPLWASQVDPLSDPSLALQHLDFPCTHQDQWETQQDFNHSSSSSYTGEDGNQLEVPAANPDTWSRPLNGGNGWALIGSSIPSLPTADDVSQVETSFWFPVTTARGQGNGFCFTSSSRDEGACSVPHFGVCCSRTGKPKAGWCKIRAAVKWGILVRHKVAAKRMAQFLYQVSRS